MKPLLFWTHCLGMMMLGFWLIPTPAQAENPNQPSSIYSPELNFLFRQIGQEEDEEEKKDHPLERPWGYRPDSEVRYVPSRLRPMYLDWTSPASPENKMLLERNRMPHVPTTGGGSSRFSLPKSNANGKGAIVLLLISLVVALGAYLMAEGVKFGDTSTMLLGLAIIVGAIVVGSWLYQRVKAKDSSEHAGTTEDSSGDESAKDLDFRPSET